MPLTDGTRPKQTTLKLLARALTERATLLRRLQGVKRDPVQKAVYAASHAVYSVTPAQLAVGRWVSAARESGWGALVRESGTAPWKLTTLGDRRSKTVAVVLSEQLADTFNRALVAAELDVRVATGRYEVRRLVCDTATLYAVWLHPVPPGVDLFVDLTSSAAPAVVTGDELRSSWRVRACRHLLAIAEHSARSLTPPASQ